MALIEVLPNTSTATAPGWAYVPDTGFDPSKAAIVPSGARKRGRNASSTAVVAGDAPIRQQNRIARHLAELDRDSQRDVAIVAPGRPKDVGAKGMRAKMTPGVRKVLLSQKTFANHLADEEAALAANASALAQMEAPQPPLQQHPPSLTRPLSGKATRAAGRPRQSSVPQAPVSNPTATSDATPSSHPPTAPPPSHTTTSTAVSDDTTSDVLLRSHLPPLPTPEELEALLVQPALPYSAARVAPPASSAPARRFCEMCGYWGRARCGKCGVRVCALGCLRAHEETRCARFYA